MECPNPDHERFRGVFGCKNGCLACEAERLKEELETVTQRYEALKVRVASAVGTLNIATPTNADEAPEHMVGVVGGMPAPHKWQCQRCGSVVTGEHCPCE